MVVNNVERNEMKKKKKERGKDEKNERYEEVTEAESKGKRWIQRANEKKKERECI